MSKIMEDVLVIAVIYTRISSVAQSKKGHGLASQETRCREFARMKGYPVEMVFSDRAVSGGMVDRPGIQNTLRYIKKNSRNRNVRYVVLIDDISRWARDVRAHLDLRDAIKEVGATLESPSIEFGEDSDSILVENLLASVSQHQRQKGAEQTKNRMRARLQNGYWPFNACLGFKYKTVPGRGKVLTRDEPLASIIQEALEGFAFGRFQTQAEVKRYLESQPAFPKNSKGEVTYEHVHRLLRRPIYAGMVVHEAWGVPMRKGQHEGLISFETFQGIQERMKEAPKAPARADINADFILRGSVACGSCGHALTACWSTSKSGKKHPYYWCFQKGCANYRKSIRRDQLEEDFLKLLDRLTPGRKFVTFAKGMFRDIWNGLMGQTEAKRKTLRADIQRTEQKVEQLMDRIVEADSTALIKSYEKRIARLEADKLILEEKLAKTGQSKGTFEEMFEHALAFLANPQKLWDSGVPEHRQTVIKLAFETRPRYCRENGFTNTEYALPFKLLGDFCGSKFVMAEREGFEPSVRLRAQRFSRPPRSTTPAPLRGATCLASQVADRNIVGKKGWKPPDFKSRARRQAVRSAQRRR